MIPIPDPEDVVLLAEQLKHARKELELLEQEWRELFMQPMTARARGPASVGTLVSRIVETLNTHPSEPYTPTKMSEELGAKINSVGPLMSRLAVEGKIERSGHGTYSAKKIETPEEEPRGTQNMNFSANTEA